MAAHDNFHSQLVGWSKIILPLGALALLSTLFLFARSGADGSKLRVTAIEGEIDSLARIARLKGLARLETSSGYSMETNGLTANLESGVINSDGALEVRAPFGQITAGQVTFATSAYNTGQQMIFTNGVRLIYRPDTSSAEDANE